MMRGGRRGLGARSNAPSVSPTRPMPGAMSPGAGMAPGKIVCENPECRYEEERQHVGPHMTGQYGTCPVCVAAGQFRSGPADDPSSCVLWQMEAQTLDHKK